MLYERFVLIRDLLASDGSIYVHCDPRINSYVRLALDEVFGRDRFQNEIAWCYTSAQDEAERKFQALFAYGKKFGSNKS